MRVEIREDQFDEPVALSIDGWDIIHLYPSLRTVAVVETLVSVLNKLPQSDLEKLLDAAKKEAERHAK